MLVRLLVAVLMLTGPLPVRLCTCAAAAGTPPPSIGFSVPESIQRATGCGCGHGTADGTPAETATDQDCVAEPAGPPAQHDHDCPAVNPRPTVSAVLTPAADLPADPGVGLFEPVELSVSNCPGASSQARPAFCYLAVPLYLSLLSLRI